MKSVNMTWNSRWAWNGQKRDEIDHRGHQLGDGDSKINIPGSKDSWTAEKIETLTREAKYQPPSEDHSPDGHSIQISRSLGFFLGTRWKVFLIFVTSLSLIFVIIRLQSF